MKILWLSREIPYPTNSGDRLYTARLVESIASCGAQLTFVGLDDRARVAKLGLSKAVRWEVVHGPQASIANFVVSNLPMVSVRFRTRAFVAHCSAALLSEKWDVIVADNYAMAWVIQLTKQLKIRGILVYTSHNFEADLTRDIARAYAGNALKKTVLIENARRTRRWEERLVRGADLVTCITDDDKAKFQTIAPRQQFVTLVPGYQGLRIASRTIDERTPLKVVMLGSYEWLPKQLNLRRFVALADEPFHRAGVEMRIIGSVPAQLQDELERAVRATKFLGFVDNVEEEFRNARAGLIFEETGGGFKLKMLDYIFHRVPVFGLKHALAGLPAPLMRFVRASDTLQTLVDDVVTRLRNDRELNEMHDHAFRTASEYFDWGEAGRKFVEAARQAASIKNQCGPGSGPA